MLKTKSLKLLKIQTVFIFLIIFIGINSFIHLQMLNRKNEEKLKATYTAESTVRRIEAQLNKYLSKSDTFKKLIESGSTLDDKQFATLSDAMLDDSNIIEAIEIAKDGIVSQIYPTETNKAAFGLNMLKNPYRKEAAILAKKSGKYTIAGPFELVQGGVGVLLFDPIYTKGENNESNFWGFSLLVINWENFVDSLELDNLEEASYHYRIWRKDLSTKEKVTIAESKDCDLSDSLEVICDVPNDTWYFDIVPTNGWISKAQIWINILLCMGLAFIATLAYWQSQIRRYKEEIYARQIKKSADEARAANEAKTRFLFNMSHDIRTPMNAIIGFSELLEKHIKDTDRAMDYLKKIRSSSTFLLSIINHVLEMSRIESGTIALKEEVGDLNSFAHSLETVFEPSIKEKHLNYHCTLNIKHDYIKCDKTKVREILLNIISNSVKYTPNDGCIDVNITELSPLKDGYATYQFIVADTGIGMSKDYLPHIFEEFSRERTSTESMVSGTGLGLPIVKSLIDLMDGTIEVESEVNKGTKTTIVLSFLTASKEENDKIPIPVEKISAKHLLLAEDNELNAEIVITILEENGFCVDLATDGLDCLKKVKAHSYDLILMDIQMPNMNGYEATREIRKFNDKMPIIAMTANAFEEDKQNAFKAGMDGYISKPIDIAKVFEEITRVLNKKMPTTM